MRNRGSGIAIKGKQLPNSESKTYWFAKHDCMIYPYFEWRQERHVAECAFYYSYEGKAPLDLAQ